MTSLSAVSSIGAANSKKLEKAGVKSLEALLEAAAKAKARKTLAEESGIDEEKLLAWVHRADLYRVKGIAEQSAGLLERAGVMTLSELSKSKPAALREAIVAANAKAKKKAVKQVPSESQVAAWLTQAKSLPKIVKV
jgi:predicted RecB family nuclease